MARPPDPATLEQFRASRVSARYYAGQGLSAYAEIAPRQDTYHQLVNLCFENDDYALLEKVLDAHAKAEPNSPDVLRDRIDLKIRQKHTAEAIGLFKAAPPKQPQDQRSLLSSFLFAMLDAGLLLEGYQAAPDADAAFQILALDCVDNNRIEHLRRQIAAHRARRPGDPRLTAYTAAVLLADKQWQEAAALLAPIVKNPPEDLRFRVQSDYLRAMSKSGRAVEAYTQADEPKSTFVQLANLLASDKEWAKLAAVVAARRAHAEEDAELLSYEARAKAYTKRPADAVPLLQKACARQSNQALRRIYIGDLALDLYKAGSGLDGYRAAPDKLVAFESLARHLLQEKKDKDLEQLLQEHEKHAANDVWLAFYAGELHALRGELPQA